MEQAWVERIGYFGEIYERFWQWHLQVARWRQQTKREISRSTADGSCRWHRVNAATNSYSDWVTPQHTKQLERCLAGRPASQSISPMDMTDIQSTCVWWIGLRQLKQDQPLTSGMNTTEYILKCLILWTKTRQLTVYQVSWHCPECKRAHSSQRVLCLYLLNIVRVAR